MSASRLKCVFAGFFVCKCWCVLFHVCVYVYFHMCMSVYVCVSLILYVKCTCVKPSMAASVNGVLQDDLQSKIKNCKLLVVGAGGIGCELMKNLVLTGFTDIEIVRFFYLSHLFSFKMSLFFHPPTMFLLLEEEKVS